MMTKLIHFETVFQQDNMTLQDSEVFSEVFLWG